MAALRDIDGVVIARRAQARRGNPFSSIIEDADSHASVSTGSE